MVPGRKCSTCVRRALALGLWHTAALFVAISHVRSYEVFVGLRYTRARQRTRFISVITLISIVGITLGMTVLITVLSVMNGFQREIRTRILDVAAHVQISGADNKLADWQSVAGRVGRNPQVEAAAPYISAQGLLTNGAAVRGVFIRGVLPQLEERVDEIGAH